MSATKSWGCSRWMRTALPLSTSSHRPTHSTAAPKSVALADSAALPTVGLTAWQALFEVAALKAGQTILINGAGGAVGGYAVQLAKKADAVVTATASARSANRLRQYAADRVVDYIDYTAVPLVDGAPFDVVLNLVSTSADETAALVGLVADGGFYVGTMTSGQDDPERRVHAQRVFVRSDAAQLAELVSRVDAGQLSIDVADRRPLADVAAVHDDSDANRLPGKTILVPSGDERSDQRGRIGFERNSIGSPHLVSSANLPSGLADASVWIIAEIPAVTPSRGCVDHVAPVGAGEVAEAKAVQIEHRAGLDVHPEGAIALDGDARGGVHSDRVGRLLHGGRCLARLIRASAQAFGAAKSEVLPGDGVRDPVVVQQAGDVEEPCPGSSRRVSQGRRRTSRCGNCGRCQWAAARRRRLRPRGRAESPVG